MYGCEFCKMDTKTYTEYCSLTGEPTNGAVMCDFEFERCPLRKEANGQEKQDNVKGVK
ncbi:MAG: hypothetical protein ACI4MQ_05540 [Candidatus Coproplasma sp.]